MNHYAAPSRPAQRWLARGAFAAVLAAVVVLIVGGDRGGLALLVVSVLAPPIVVVALYAFLACRGLIRWIALAVAAATPVLVIVFFLWQRVFLEVLLAVGLLVVAGLLGGAALALDSTPPSTPTYETPPPRRPFFVMNPRSGGGKVVKFRLAERAKELGAE